MIPFQTYSYNQFLYDNLPANQNPFNFLPYNYFYMDYNPQQVASNYPVYSVPEVKVSEEPQYIFEPHHSSMIASEQPRQNCPQPITVKLQPLQTKRQGCQQKIDQPKDSQQPKKRAKINQEPDKTPVEPQLSRFVKKNTESNIVNQIFSFLWSPEKSQSYLMQVFSTHRQIQTFYSLMRSVKLKCKGQLNRMFLKQLLDVQQWPASFKKLKDKISDCDVLESEQLALALRKLCFIYVRDISRKSLLTSKKMNLKLWDVHFKKCREIESHLFAPSLS